MNVSSVTRKSIVVAFNPEEPDETYDTVLLVLPERKDIRMSAVDAQVLGQRLLSAQGLRVHILSAEEG